MFVLTTYISGVDENSKNVENVAAQMTWCDVDSFCRNRNMQKEDGG